MPTLTPFLASLGGTKHLRAPSPETPTTPPSPAPAPKGGLPLGQAPTQHTSPPLFPSLYPLCDMQETLPGAASAAPHRQPSRLGGHQSPPRGGVRLPGPGRPPLPAAHRRLPRTGRAGPSPGAAKQSPEASRPAERPGHAAARAGEGRGGEGTGAALPLSRSRPLGPRRMRGGQAHGGGRHFVPRRASSRG